MPISPQINDEISFLNEEIVNVNIDTKEAPKLIKVGAWLTLEERERYRLLLIESYDLFAWPYYDIPILDPNFVIHSLVVNNDVKPIPKSLEKYILK